MQKDLIFDIGCHIGEDSNFYLKKGFRVVAVEANPQLCQDLRERFSAEISQGRLILVDKAIAETPGDVPFHINDDNTIWGTTENAWRDKLLKRGIKSRTIHVPAIDFASLIEEFGVPYYLKVDIEGADHFCLSGLSGLSSLPRFVSFESEISSPFGLLSDMKKLSDLGYSTFKVIDQSRIEGQTEPVPHREGLSTNHRFHLGSSGLFGEDLPGQWLTRSEALAQFAKIFFTHRAHGIARRFPGLNAWALRNPVGWYDTHAKLT